MGACEKHPPAEKRTNSPSRRNFLIMDSEHRAALTSSYSSSLPFYQQMTFAAMLAIDWYRPRRAPLEVQRWGESIGRQAQLFEALTDYLVKIAEGQALANQTSLLARNRQSPPLRSLALISRLGRPCARRRNEATACAPNRPMPPEILPGAQAHTLAASAL